MLHVNVKCQDKNITTYNLARMNMLRVRAIGSKGPGSWSTPITPLAS